MAKTTSKHPDSDLIDKLGGTSKAAKFFEVKAPSISGWRKTGLPKARMMFLRLARPDLINERRENDRRERERRQAERRAKQRRKSAT